MPWLKQRTIALTPDAQQELEEARNLFPRFDQVWEGITWLLARDPRPAGSFLTTLHGKEFVMYGFEGDSVAKTPTMWLVYEYDDEQVAIHGINAMAASGPADPEIDGE